MSNTTCLSCGKEKSEGGDICNLCQKEIDERITALGKTPAERLKDIPENHKCKGCTYRFPACSQYCPADKKRKEERKKFNEERRSYYASRIKVFNFAKNKKF